MSRGECICCGEKDGKHWHACPSRKKDSVCPCPGCVPQTVKKPAKKRRRAK